MERALIDGELESEKRHLQQEEKECEALKDQIIQLEEDYILQREKVSFFFQPFSLDLTKKKSTLMSIRHV